MLDYDNEVVAFLLTAICHEYSVSPFVPFESEIFFRELLTHYSDDPDEASISRWLRQEVEKYFVALSERPRWVQSPEWPFANGKPMIFVSQIDLSVHPGKPIAEFFHDDTSLYVFVGKKVSPVVIIQQF